MGVRIIELFDDAAGELTDAGRSRIGNDIWLQIYNRAMRDVCSRHPVYTVIDDFDLSAMQGEMPWPDLMVQCTGIQVSDTPSDDTSFRWLGEMNEERFRQSTQQRYMDQAVPDYYSPEGANRFWLFPRPTADIAGGGIIHYATIPDKATSATLTDFPLPIFARDYVAQRMVYYAHKRLNEYQEAQANNTDWMEHAAEIRERLEDRTDDARPKMRPSSSHLASRSW